MIKQKSEIGYDKKKNQKFAQNVKEVPQIPEEIISLTEHLLEI
nr:hypothetical protein [Mycoplasmopsis bovis]